MNHQSYRDFYVSPPQNPEISRSRHEDPEYINSSDIDSFDYMLSSSSTPSYDTGSQSLGMPSSPPQSHLETDDNTSTDDDEFTTSYNSKSDLKFLGDQVTPASAKKSLSNMIEKVFEDESFQILNACGFSLTEVPEEFEDLAKYVELGDRMLNMSLAYNKLVTLPFYMYQIERLKFLNLSWNNVTYLSPMIGQLTGLVELNLSHNELRTLPAEILNLKNLHSLLTYPNPFMKFEGENPIIRQRSSAESLVDKCGKTVVKWGSTNTDYKNFKKLMDQLGPEYVLCARNALKSMRIGMVCSLCNEVYVNAIVRMIQFRRVKSNLGGDVLPLERNYCSVSCWTTHHNELFRHDQGSECWHLKISKPM